ncbi:MAG TPA: hypothetical protein VFS21_19340 [Roseiflexaceae bacterium]|nr:hypothetical protein [Roseiflexaceae bacterium]
MPPTPNWQPLSMLPTIAALIDDAVADTAEQLRTLRAAAARPHVLDDATLDRLERSYGEQQDFLPIYEQQLARWRAGRLTPAQAREIGRLEGEVGTLRTTLGEILGLAQHLRAGTIDAVQRKSDFELGLEALRGAGSLRQATEMVEAAAQRVGRGKPRPGQQPAAPASSTTPAGPASTPPAGAPFALPPEVRVESELRGQAMIYTFHHTHLGQLGRVVAQQIAPGQTQLSAELSGDPADPMTAERRRTFEPIAAGIFAAFGHLPPVLDPAPLQPTPPGDGATIASTLVACPRCKEPVALLLFADGRPLEDVARLMFPKLQELNRLAWVVGAPAEDGRAEVLPIFPQREPVRLMRQAEINRAMDALMEAHCQRPGRR